jgi:hypothetical protein
LIVLIERCQPRSARAGNSLLDELSGVLFDMSLEGDGVAVLELSTVVDVDGSVLLMVPAAGVELSAAGAAVELSAAGAAVVPLLGCDIVPSLVGSEVVEGSLSVLGVSYGLDAAFGELLFGTESVVWAMVTPAALTMATTAAMLKVLDTSFMFELLFPSTNPALGAATRQGASVRRVGQHLFQSRGCCGRKTCRTILTCA